MAFIVGIFGLLLGSFANVLVYRYDSLFSVVAGRSECPHCHTQLRWYDLIPVLSYLSLGGRCRYCKKTISFQYPLVELLVALLAVNSFLAFGLTFSALAFFVTFYLLIIIATIDIRELVVPDIYAIPAVIAAAAFTFTRPDMDLMAIFYGVLLAGGGIATLVFISKEKWMGSGDISLGIILGLLGSITGAAVGLTAAFILGTLVGLLLIAVKKVKLKGAVIPFGPFLVLGSYIAGLWGPQIFSWYLNAIGYF